MRRRSIGFELSCVAFLFLVQRPVSGGEIVTPLQTQSTSAPGVLVATNWGPGTNGVTNPLVFDQFNPHLGTLTSIDLTLTTTVRNDYELIFVKTPIPTTIYVATSQTTDPSVLADPSKRALLTDGPTVTLFGPNGSTQIFGAPATRQPVDFVQLTESSGTWSSLFPITNPNFIPPTMTEQSFSLGLTAANAPSLFSEFIGTGEVDLPVTATAFSSFFTSSGNGGGAVLTAASAVVTVQYSYFAATTIPEPSSVILLGLGIGMSFLASRRTRRGACTSKSDRP
jgi:PEP-CTERM motif